MLERHSAESYADHPYFESSGYVPDSDESELNRFFLALLSEHVKPDARITEFGVGTGRFLLSARQAGFQVMGWEPCSALAHRVRSLLKIPVAVGSYDEAPSEGDVDAVVCLDIIEHVADPRGLLRKAFEALRPGGVLLVTTLDTGSLLFQLGSWVARFPFLDRVRRPILERIYCFQHNWLFSFQILARLVEEAGFTVERHSGFGQPVERIRAGSALMLGVRAVFLLQRLVGRSNEQYVLARRPDN
jgi:SAM-dependent methyltransferase